MLRVPRFAVAALALACSAGLSHAKELVIETPGERTLTNKLVLAGVAVSGGVAGALGVYWHLDSKSASDEVSAADYTGKSWTPARAALVEQADRSSTRAMIAYGIGGALLVSTVIAMIVTEPASEVTVIQTTAAPTFAPVEGGAVLGGVWSF